MPAGNAYLSGHLVPSPIVGLACAPIETRFLELAMSLLVFSPRIPLGTFSILLSIYSKIGWTGSVKRRSRKKAYTDSIHGVCYENDHDKSCIRQYLFKLSRKTLLTSPFLGLACAPIVETSFLELAMSLQDFSPWIPLGTFSILLTTLYRAIFGNFTVILSKLFFTRNKYSFSCWSAVVTIKH